VHPRFIITINGTPVSGFFLSRLKSITINDRAGRRSDSIELELDDGNPFIEVPDKRAVIRVWGGYEETGIDYFGAFSDADVELDCIPYGMRISAKAADLKEGLKKHQERHWDGATVGQVFGDLASENGLSAQVAPALASLKFPNDWAGMQNESVLHFGQRIADRIGGIFAVKDGKLIMAEKGTGQSPAGAGMGELIITRRMIKPGTCKVHFAAREKVSKVKAEYQDRDKAKRETVEVEGDARAGQGSEYTLRQPLAVKDEATRAAQAKAK
jgi:phage protein D